MRAATRIAFLVPLAAIAVGTTGCATPRNDQPDIRPAADTAPLSVTADPTTAPPGASRARPATAPIPVLRRVDWKNATLTLPRLRPGSTCEGGTVRFVKGVATTKSSIYGILPAGSKPVHGNVAGSRHPETLVRVDCGPRNGEYSNHVVAFTTAAKPRALGSIKVNDWSEKITAVRVTDKKVVELTVKEGLTHYPRIQLRGFAWNGTAFKQVSGPAKFPPPVDGYTFDWSRATLAIPFKGASTTVQPNDRSCPRVTVTFKRIRDGEGVAQAGGCEYWVKKVATTHFDNDDTPDSLVKITATRMGTNDLTTGAEWYFAYGFRHHEPVLLGYVTAAGLDNRDDNLPPDVTATAVSAEFGLVHVTQVFRTPGQPNQTLSRSFRWNGSRFAANRPAPNPRADVAS